jgi:hypothetical protein
MSVHEQVQRTISYTPAWGFLNWSSLPTQLLKHQNCQPLGKGVWYQKHVKWKNNSIKDDNLLSVKKKSQYDLL